MTQRRVENTRVHFWTFSPVSVKNQNKFSTTMLTENFKPLLFKVMKLEGITTLIINTGEVITENQNNIEISETEKKHSV